MAQMTNHSLVLPGRSNRSWSNPANPSLSTQNCGILQLVPISIVTISDKIRRNGLNPWRQFPDAFAVRKMPVGRWFENCTMHASLLPFATLSVLKWTLVASCGCGNFNLKLSLTFLPKLTANVTSTPSVCQQQLSSYSISAVLRHALKYDQTQWLIWWSNWTLHRKLN